MIRAVLIAAMLAILSIVLYIPSAVPPQRFIDLIRIEHTANLHLWGPETSNRIMRRMLAVQDQSGRLSDAPTPVARIGQQPAVDLAIARNVSSMGDRLFKNPYFVSIDALFALVVYRLSAAVEMLPLVCMLLLLFGVDGLVVRKVRSREFVAHNAEVAGASVVISICVGATLFASWFLPLQMHPMTVMCAAVLLAFSANRAIANYYVSS